MTTTTTPPEDLERPVSPHTAAILLLLYEEPRSVREISEMLGLKESVVRRILNYFRKKGWTARNSPYWTLTKVGRSYVQKYYKYLLRTSSKTYNLPLISDEQNRTEAYTSVHRRTEPYTNLTTRLNSCLEALISELQVELSEEARQLLEDLITNFVERGSSYLYAHILIERQGWDRTTLMRAALELKGYGIAYIWKDGKIGLRKPVQHLISFIC